LASPGHYFELQFNALANTPYRVWLRLRAGSNSRFNDSVWVQFSDSLVSGRALYKIGTTSALAVNLETCANCGVKGWGWSNSAYWLKQGSVITFARSGTQKIRVQTREDGIEIDQVVLSAATYVSAAPGLASNDTTILSKTGSSATPASTPFTGTPIVLPGTINAAYFDNGGAGVAYTDSTAGNTGGVFRNTDVDLQPASVGGHNIAWTTAGESVTYTVNVGSSGTYTATFMVASVGGGTVQVVASAPSGTSKTVTVPNTGGSQNWNKVSVPLTLVAGQQKITVKFQTANVNFRSLTIR
jgi:hypothetical protein